MLKRMHEPALTQPPRRRVKMALPLRSTPPRRRSGEATVTRSSRPRQRKRFAGTLRVIVMSGAVTAATATWLVNAAWVRAQELLAATGDQLMHYAGATQQDGERTVHLNGSTLRLRTGTTTTHIKELLDVFHARCRQRNGRFAQQLQELQGTRAAHVPASARSWPFADGVLRLEAASEGFVACLDAGGGRVTVSELVRRFGALAATGDLSQLGHLRYVRARRGGDSTTFVALWTDGPMNLASMFPNEGDAPGQDLRGLPRPGGSRRLLSFWEQDQAPWLGMYASPLGRQQLLEKYLVQLGEAGWTPSQQKLLQPTGGFVVGRHGALAAVAAAGGPDATLVTVSLLR